VALGSIKEIVWRNCLKSKKHTSSYVIFLLVFCTFIYIWLILAMINNISSCSEYVAIEDYFSRYLSCISINELGDFLAGAFAPLAFIWLAGAVFLQSRELTAQRQELEETRNVMREQAAESRATKEYIGEQTKMLSAEQDLRKREQADEAYDELMRGLDQSLENSNLSFNFERIEPTESQKLYGDLSEVWTIRTTVSVVVSPQRAMRSMLQGIANVNSALDAQGGKGMRLGDWDRIGADEIANRLERLLHIEERLSEPHEVRAQMLPTAELHGALTELVTRCSRARVVNALISGSEQT
jgi:hypothetical protein